MTSIHSIAVVIPHYQRKPGLLCNALRSVFAQTVTEKVIAIVVDDGSPSPATEDIASMPDLPVDQVKLVQRKNGGAGAARNTALDNIPAGVEYVAFLDSDDTWRPQHLENALKGLAAGYDAYFADWWSFNFPEQTNFQRIRALDPDKHVRLPDTNNIYELGVTPIEHILRDGGGVIQTSTVVYRYEPFKSLRFREEFYNGQDFFFWMDLGELGARFIFCTETDCENGEGINIYQGSGWGTERSLQRIRNELFVWTSARRFYQLTPEQKTANLKTIRNLQRSAVRDIIYRIRRGMPVAAQLVKDIIRFDPAFILIAPLVPLEIIRDKFLRTQ